MTQLTQGSDMELLTMFLYDRKKALDAKDFKAVDRLDKMFLDAINTRQQRSIDRAVRSARIHDLVAVQVKALQLNATDEERLDLVRQYVNKELQQLSPTTIEDKEVK